MLFRKDNLLCAIVAIIKTFVSYVNKYLHWMMVFFCPGFINLIYLRILLFMAGEVVNLAIAITF